jgi:hypothetical protein
MNLPLMLLTLQVLVTVFALIRESGEDERFAGDKLGYRRLIFGRLRSRYIAGFPKRNSPCFEMNRQPVQIG